MFSELRGKQVKILRGPATVNGEQAIKDKRHPLVKAGKEDRRAKSHKPGDLHE